MAIVSHLAASSREICRAQLARRAAGLRTSGSCSRFESQTPARWCRIARRLPRLRNFCVNRSRAVALDERDERFHSASVGEPLDDAQPQRAAVGRASG